MLITRGLEKNIWCVHHIGAFVIVTVPMKHVYKFLIFNLCKYMCIIFSSKLHEYRMDYKIDVCRQFWGHGEGMVLFRRLLTTYNNDEVPNSS